MPLSMDVFRTDAFSAISMTNALDKLGYVPGLLGSIPGLFESVPVSTTDVFIEERSNAPALIQTSQRGAPPDQKGNEGRDVRSFRTLRLALSSRIMAAQLQNIRAFGSETEQQTLQGEMARRQLLMRRDMELTWENMRLGCILGLVKDANGATLFDWATEFEQTIPTELDFDLDAATPASGVVRKKCTEIKRVMLRNLKGLGGNDLRIFGLCGDAFWDDLTAHSEVRQTYLNTQQAASLREGLAFEQFGYGGINFINYRSTDDGGATPTVGIPTDTCKFFPANAGIFQIAWAPAERFEFVNTPGRQLYSWVVTDEKRDSYADCELYSYPLPVCVMPSGLHRARRT